MDPTELRVYVGGADGRLYASNLYRATASGAFQGLSQGTSLESGVSNTAGKSQDGLALVGHKESITSLSLSLDGSLLVSGSKDGAVIVWDTSSGQSLRTFPQHKGMFFSVMSDEFSQLLALDTSLMHLSHRTHH